MPTESDDRALALKACKGNARCEQLIPLLLHAPLSDTQRYALITIWLSPMASAFASAGSSKKHSLTTVLLMHFCHGAIAICHLLGTFIKSHAFAIIGVALAATASTCAALQSRLANASAAQHTGDALEMIGVRFLASTGGQTAVADDAFSRLLDELAAANMAAAGAPRKGGPPSRNAKAGGSTAKVELSA